MAKIGLFTGQQKKWQGFDEDTEFLISYLDAPAGREMNKKVDQLVNRTAGDRNAIWNQQLGERTLHGWRHKENHDQPGLLNADGNPIPFTPENRDLLMKNCREVSLFVSEVCLDPKVFLESQQEAADKEASKNV